MYQNAFGFVRSIDVKPRNLTITKANLNMYNPTLFDKMYPKDLKINKNYDKSCVVNYLLDTICRKFPNYKGFNRPALETYFKHDSSSNRIIQWAKDCGKQVSVYILDSLNTTFLTYHPHKTWIDYPLVFKSHDMHLFPVDDTKVKDYVIAHKRMPMNDYKFELSHYDDMVYMDSKELYDQIGDLNVKSKLIVVDADDLSCLYSQCTTLTNTIIHDAFIPASKINAFKHPNGYNIIVSGEEFKDRKMICERLFKITRYKSLFLFRNQTYQLLGSIYLEA
jgi:hypothetical protein